MIEVNFEDYFITGDLVVDLRGRAIRTLRPVSKGGHRMIKLRELLCNDVSALREAGYTVSDTGPRRFIGLKETEGVTFMVARERVPALLVLFYNWERVGYVTFDRLAKLEEMAQRGFRL